MKELPPPGVELRREITVGELDSIRLGRRRLAVFSTPAMVLLLELTAREMLQAYLEPGEESVGVSVEVEHAAPTPLGEKVWANVRLESAQGKLADFSVQVFDRSGEIGRARHRRAIVGMDAFEIRMTKRMNRTPPPESPAPSTGTVQWTERGGVVDLVLSRPAQRNAIDAAMTAELESALARLEGHATARVVVLRGAGGAFCAGEDIRENAEFSSEESLRMAARRGGVCRRFAGLRQPVIALVDGPCLGGGFALALHADWILATPGATFGFPEIKLGWPPAYGLDALSMRVGSGTAWELVLRGESISASTASALGLVRFVGPAQLREIELKNLVDEMLRLSAGAVAATKARLWNCGGGLTVEELRAELEAYGRCRAGPDAREGISAFLEKRRARFNR